jgi:hypothetical protein
MDRKARAKGDGTPPKPKKSSTAQKKRKPGVKDGTPQEGKRGRPSIYTEALGDEICKRLADGESLNAICKDSHMPDERAVRYWALDLAHSFSPKYTRAREVQAMRWADELLDIADDNVGDVVSSDDGVERVNHDHIARSRLRVDTRKWLLSKMLPKVFGEVMTNKHTGHDGGAVKVGVTVMTPSKFEEIARRVSTEF